MRKPLRVFFAVMPCHKAIIATPGFPYVTSPRTLAAGHWVFSGVGLYTLVSAGFFRFNLRDVNIILAGDWNLQDWKMTDEVAGEETAGLEKWLATAAGGPLPLPPRRMSI